MFVFDLVRRHGRTAHLHSLLVPEDILDPRPGPGKESRFTSSPGFEVSAVLLPGVNHVGPVLARVRWQLLPPLDYEDTGVADLADPCTLQLETPEAIILVLTAVCEPRAGKIFLVKNGAVIVVFESPAGFRLADTAAILRSVQLRLERTHFLILFRFLRHLERY